jgi:hypothetical protein
MIRWQVAAEVIIQCNETPVEEVTALLRMAPSRVVRKGVSARPGAAPPKQTLWIHQREFEDNSDPAEAVFDAWIELVCYFDTTTPPLAFERDVIAALAARGLALDIDLIQISFAESGA